MLGAFRNTNLPNDFERIAFTWRPLIFMIFTVRLKRKPRLEASAPFLSPHPQLMCERLVFICAQSWSWRGKRCRAVKLKEEIHQRGVMNLVQSQLGREALWARRCGEFWWSRFLCWSNGLGICVWVCVWLPVVSVGRQARWTVLQASPLLILSLNCELRSWKPSDPRPRVLNGNRGVGDEVESCRRGSLHLIKLKAGIQQ